MCKKMAKKIIAYNIVVIPTPVIARLAIRVSKNLKTTHSYFTLDDKKYFPHITLYMATFNTRHIGQVKRLLGSIAQKTKPFPIYSSHYRTISPGYVDMSFIRSKSIAALQRHIIQALNSLRHHSDSTLLGLRSLQRKNVLRYGYRSVGRNYTPHLTIARFKKLPNSIRSSIPKMNFSFTALALGIYLLAEHGTCKKLVAKFTIGK